MNAKDDNFERTPLHWAAVGSKESAVIALLLDHGANINATDHSGETPLHLAAGADEAAATIIPLVNRGADIHAKDDLGLTPLEIAVWSHGPEVITLLLQHQSDRDITNDRGLTLVVSHVRNRRDRAGEVWIGRPGC